MSTEIEYYTGTTLFEVMAAQGRRQDWLAAQVGCSKALVSMVKHGKRRIPRWFAERAAAALGLPIDVLFFGPVRAEARESVPSASLDSGEATRDAA